MKGIFWTKSFDLVYSSVLYFKDEAFTPPDQIQKDSDVIYLFL